MARLSLFGGTDPAAVSGAVDSVAVLGLGRFGASVALELMKSGAQVLGVDNNGESVQKLNTKLTHVVRGDTTDEEVLNELAVGEFDRVVVAIGSDIEASILTASLVVGMGVPDVWAKAVTDPHARILRQLGVQHVIQPEKDMGRRVAHLVRGALLDYVELGTDFALVRTIPTAELQGKRLGQLDLWDRHEVSVVAVKEPGQGWRPASPDTVLGPNDMIQVVGSINAVERFGRLA